VRTVHVRVDGAELSTLGRHYAELAHEQHRWLAQHALTPEATSVRYSADMRYVGQSYEIEVEVDARWLAGNDPAPLLAAFHRGHERMYGHADERAPAEIVNLRVQLRGTMPRVPLEEARPGPTKPTPRMTRRIALDGTTVDAWVYDRQALGRGALIAGPAIVEQDDTTVLLPIGFAGEVDRFGNLLLRRET
jgi:N-methylhydantoinase A